MGRILAVDYGRKRCGIAATDPLRLVANGLTTVASHTLPDFLKSYMEKEPVDALVMGLPTTLKGQASESQKYLLPALGRLRRLFPSLPIVMFDERFTSAIAHQAMLSSGMKKMQRRNREIVDEISAAIILNDFLQSRMFADGSYLSQVIE